MTRRRWETSTGSSFLGAAPAKCTLAAESRRHATPAEAALWQCLRGRKLLGVKFRRQHPIAGFIVDFYAAAHGLALEIDGDVHDAQKDEDNRRSEILAAHGVRVLRMRNDLVLGDRDNALRQIACALDEKFHGIATNEGVRVSPSPDRE